jgi:hypothetical protein
VRKLKFFILAAAVISVSALSMTSCSKSNNNNSSSTADTVYYSNWVAVNTTFNVTDSAWEQDITASAITQAALTHSVILSYIQYSGYVYNSGDFGVYPAYKVGDINLLSGVGQIATAAGVMFRYMIIPGNKLVTSSNPSVKTATPAQLKDLPYSTIAKMYNIPN